MLKTLKNNDLNTNVTTYFDQTDYYKPISTDLCDIEEINADIMRFKNLLIKFILKHWNTKDFNEALKSAFKYFYVRVADAVLINFEEGYCSFKKHFNFYPTDLLNSMYAISPYLPLYNVNVDDYLEKGEAYYNKFQEYLEENKIASQTEILRKSLHEAFDYISRCTIYDVLIDASNTDNKQCMVICRTEKLIRQARSAVEAIEIESMNRGWINGNYQEIPQIENELYKKNGIVEDCIHFLLYKCNPDRLPDDLYFMYRYLIGKTLEVLLEFDQTNKVFLDYDILNFSKYQPSKSLIKVISISSTISETVMIFLVNNIDNEEEFVRELVSTIRYMPKLALNYGMKVKSELK